MLDQMMSNETLYLFVVDFMFSTNEILAMPLAEFDKTVPYFCSEIFFF